MFLPPSQTFPASCWPGILKLEILAAGRGGGAAHNSFHLARDARLLSPMLRISLFVHVVSGCSCLAKLELLAHGAGRLHALDDFVLDTYDPTHNVVAGLFVQNIKVIAHFVAKLNAFLRSCISKFQDFFNNPQPQ